MKKIFQFLMIVSVAFYFTACNSESSTEATEDTGTEEVSKDGKEYTAEYICPMHCKGSGSDKPGTCPVCKMDYRKNDDGDNHDEHDHDSEDHDHESEGDGHDHDHDDHDGHSH